MLRESRLHYLRRSDYFVWAFLFLAINDVTIFCLVAYDVWGTKLSYAALLVVNALLVLTCRKRALERREGAGRQEVAAAACAKRIAASGSIR